MTALTPAPTGFLAWTWPTGASRAGLVVALLLLIGLAAPASAQPEGFKLSPDDAGVMDQFGASVAISGEMVLVGAPSHTGRAGAPPFGIDSQGAAYVYTRSGATWLQQAKLLAPDGAPGDNFGWSVALGVDTAV